MPHILCDTLRSAPPSLPAGSGAPAEARGELVEVHVGLVRGEVAVRALHGLVQVPQHAADLPPVDATLAGVVLREEGPQEPPQTSAICAQ